MYHTATGGTRIQSSLALEHLLKGKPVKLVLGKATTLDRAAKALTLEDKTVMPYDKIVFALGVVTNYFGIPGLQEFSYGVKTIDEAEALKRHLHQQIIDEGKPDLNYVIVGGGPTGIELAGSMPRYMREVIRRHGLKDRALHIDLVEGTPHLLPRSPQAVGKAVERRLIKLGIELYLGQAVQGETADELTVGGKPIRSHTVIWTAGMTNNPFFAANNFKLGPHKKILVDEFLRADDDKNIYVAGDNAETQYSGLAQTAITDAEFLAANLVREASGQTKLAYTPKKPISVMPAGPHWSAVEWGRFHFYGVLGWWLREAADFVAFEDLESPVQAAEQWATTFQRQDLCPVCGSVM